MTQNGEIIDVTSIFSSQWRKYQFVSKLWQWLYIAMKISGPLQKHWKMSPNMSFEKLFIDNFDW